MREAKAFCGRSSYQACTTRGSEGTVARYRCTANGCASPRNAAVIAVLTVFRCLKFSMNWAAAVRFLRILKGTLELAVSFPTSVSGESGNEHSWPASTPEI